MAVGWEEGKEEVGWTGHVVAASPCLDATGGPVWGGMSFTLGLREGIHDLE